jgi:hypothetical protein
MAVVGAPFLCAVGRALARIHVEHDDARLAPLVHPVDPPARQIGEAARFSGRVRHSVSKRPIWLGRGSLTHWCPTLWVKQTGSFFSPDAATMEMLAKNCARLARAAGRGGLSSALGGKRAHKSPCSGCAERAPQSGHRPGGASTRDVLYVAKGALGLLEPRPPGMTEPTDPSARSVRATRW